MTEGDSSRAAVRSARAEVESLAVDDGRFHVACRSTGRRPEPVAGESFATEAAASRACEVASDYRDALREVDPGLPSYDLQVYETGDQSLDVVRQREFTDERRANGLPVARETVTVSGSGAGEWLRLTDAPIVHVAGRDEPLDDEVVERQIDAKLHRPGENGA